MAELSFERQNADKLYARFRNSEKMASHVNICTGIPNWNSCDFVDFYQTESMREDGKRLCWQQSKVCDCIRAKLETK